MSKPLRLLLKSVTCSRGPSGQSGKDEMYLLAFGMTGEGQQLFVPPTALGSYGTGDRNKGAFPKALLDVVVSDDEMMAALCFWMFERDATGLARSGPQLLASFQTSFSKFLELDAELALPPVGLHFYAFAQSMMDMRLSLQAGTSNLFSCDELMLPRFQHLHASLPKPGPGLGNGFDLQISADGLYELAFDYQFRPQRLAYA
jgi:hypothetical protein